MLKGAKAKKFMEQARESVATGSTSFHEVIAVACIVQRMYGMDSDDRTEWSKFNAQLGLTVYKALLSLAKVLNLQVPLFERNEDEIITIMSKCA